MAEKKETAAKKEPVAKKEPAKKDTAAKKESAAKKEPAKKAPAKKPAAEKSPFLLYKGRPLVRSGDTLYYGKMNEEYVVMLQIKSKTEKNGMTVADKVSVQVIATDPNINMRNRIIKTSEKTGLYNAMELGEIWLTRALAGKLS